PAARRAPEDVGGRRTQPAAPRAFLLGSRRPGTRAPALAAGAAVVVPVPALAVLAVGHDDRFIARPISRRRSAPPGRPCRTDRYRARDRAAAGTPCGRRSVPSAR